MTESTDTYIVKSYNEIETLIEDKKKELLKLYLNTLKLVFSKILCVKPIDYFMGDVINLPMPCDFESYDYSHLIIDTDLAKLGESLSNTFFPFIIQIKWMNYMQLSSYSKKIVGIINLNQDLEKHRTISVDHEDSIENLSQKYKHICTAAELRLIHNELNFLSNHYDEFAKTIYTTNISHIVDSLNTHFNPKNFPKCLDKKQFCSFETKHINVFHIYNLDNKDLTKKICNTINEKILKIFKDNFPKIYPNLEIIYDVQSEFNKSFLSGDNLVIKIKLTSCYNIKNVKKNLIEEY